MKKFKNVFSKTWFFDIDDTLIDTAKSSRLASTGIAKVFSEDVRKEFDRLFELMLTGHRASKESENFPEEEEYKKLLNKIEQLQAPIKEKFGAVKKWSRETLIKVALDDLIIVHDADSIILAADKYWDLIGEDVEVFPGTQDLLNAIKNANGFKVFVTSSDARLTYDGRFFDYDPQYSETKKKKRIDTLQSLGISYDILSIGDPEDKPNSEFFKKALKLVQDIEGREFDLTESIIVGDSYSSDLQTPLDELGFGIGILFKKGQAELSWEDGNLLSAGNLFSAGKSLQK